MKLHRIQAEIKAVESNDPNGEFEVILSAPTLDRDGEVIDAKAFEPLPDHITFDIDHGMSVEKTVGSGTPFYDGDLLKVRGTYASVPLAQQVVRPLVREGHIRSTSVAFMEATREVKDGVPHIVKAELLNGAFVAIPSNREADVLVGKSLTARRDRKSIAGSMEYRRDLIQSAIRDANPEAWWCGVIATFDDSVVYEIDTMDGAETYQASYSIDGESVTLGVATAVEVTEVIQPAKGVGLTPEETQYLNDRKFVPEKSAATDPEKAAAPAAAAPADVTVAKARAAALAAQAELLLIA